MEGDRNKNGVSSKGGRSVIVDENEIVMILQDITANSDSVIRKDKKAVDNKSSIKNQQISRNEEEPMYERQKRCLQITTETMSLLAMLVGFSLAVVTPWFLLGIFTFPGPHTPLLTTAMWICCIISIVSIVLGSLLGNVLWYYDKSISRWRFVFHCGSPKTRHHWGDCYTKRKAKDIIIEHL